MKRKFLKAFRGCCTGGAVAVGAYNALLLVRYFQGGRQESFLRADLMLADAAVFAAATLASFVLWLVFFSSGGGRGSGCNGPA